MEYNLIVWEWNRVSNWGIGGGSVVVGGKQGRFFPLPPSAW